jgi:hypothetical protein
MPFYERRPSRVLRGINLINSHLYPLELARLYFERSISKNPIDISRRSHEAASRSRTTWPCQ